MSLILAIDTETAGLPNDRFPDDHPAQPPLVQLGAILFDEDNGGEWATLELIVRPDGKYKIPDSAAKIHGVTTALAEAVGIPLSLAVPAYVHLRARAAKIMAWNAPFDLTIMRQAIARNGRPVTLPGPEAVIDVMLEATPVCAMPKSEKSRSSKIVDGQFKYPKLAEAYSFFFGKDFRSPGGFHGALADARAAKEVWFEMRRRKEMADASE